MKGAVVTEQRDSQCPRCVRVRSLAGKWAQRQGVTLQVERSEPDPGDAIYLTKQIWFEPHASPTELLSQPSNPPPASPGQ